MEHLGAEEVWEICDITIMSTVVHTWALMLIVTIGALIIKSKLEKDPTKAPGRIQCLVEMIFDFLISMIKDNAGEKAMKAFPLIATLFIFILVGNWAGNVPFFHSPTSDLNTTAALALTVFFSIQVLGAKEKGAGFFSHFFKPYALMFPLNIIEEVSKPLSLAFRLFGNVMGEHIVVAVLLFLVPCLVPIPMMMFGLFTGALQAYVFSILTTSYLAAVYADHH